MKHMTKRRIWIIAGATLAVILLVFGACAIYVFDYYRADEGAVVPFAPEENITVSRLDGGDVVFEPEGATVGFIFYPGGKVDHNAYQPLLAALAREGILCVLVKMPLRLAVLDINAADGIRGEYPQITDWYIGGHSLGGSMAASYLEKHTDEYKGLILLGAYSTADLSDSGLRVLSVYGTEDKVLDRKKYDENKANLPSDFTEAVIAGGCHAYFGMYGAQDGDGVPTISNHEQIGLTVACILDTLRKTEG